METWDLPEKPIDMAIGFDNEKIGRDVASYLIGKGYHHLGFFGSIEERSMKRMKGFTDEVTRRGHCIVAQEVVNPPSSLADGARMLSKLVARAPNVRAIFCSNDTMAAGTGTHCHHRLCRFTDFSRQHTESDHRAYRTQGNGYPRRQNAVIPT